MIDKYVYLLMVGVTAVYAFAMGWRSRGEWDAGSRAKRERDETRRRLREEM